MLQEEIRKHLDQYYTILNATNNLYSAWAKQKGLSYHTLLVLYALCRSGSGCRQSDICNDWMIPKQTVNSVLKSLEARGYVSYQVQPEDRRNKRVLLTPAGLAYAQPILEDLYRLEASALAEMPPETLRQIIDNDRQFYDGLKKQINGES